MLGKSERGAISVYAQKALDFARKCWDEADAAMSKVGEKELEAIVKTPWNMMVPGKAILNMLSDEFLHHRGRPFLFSTSPPPRSCT